MRCDITAMLKASKADLDAVVLLVLQMGKKLVEGPG
jgi:hypothetical protein